MYLKYQVHPTKIFRIFYFLTFWIWSKCGQVWELVGESEFVVESEFVGDCEFVVESRVVDESEN